MSIRRSGIRNAIYVVSTANLTLGDIKIKAGEKFELIQDLGSVYVLKTLDAQEIIAPKSIFRDEEDQS